MDDTIGNRMKQLEEDAGVHATISTRQCIYVRIDGRSFHTWTKKAKLSYADARMITSMAEATASAAKALDADIAYCQSDEVSFGWFAKENPLSQHVFGGRIHKINSVIPSHFNAVFSDMIRTLMDWKTEIPAPSFDSRIVGMSEADMQTMFYWRYLDARRNGLNGFAQQHFSHNKLQYKSVEEVTQMLVRENLWDQFEQMDLSVREGSFWANPKYGIEWIYRADFIKMFDRQHRNRLRESSKEIRRQNHGEKE